MTDEGCCLRCDALVETGTHAVRDCLFAANIWKWLVPQHDWAFFSSSSLEDWVKMILLKSYSSTIDVNIDGSVPKHTSSAAVGGVIRDHKRDWLFGFGMRIDRSGIFQIEARALYEGLVVTWHERFQQIEVESDNSILIDVVSNGYAVDSKPSEIRLIHTMILKK
ncbi:hypothetical protein J1N35_024843 [Gossypium stocksii]|uniref:RNase H type-1 domain-containing protein n=1 Tax=Gossypium stocksii TaxID=47602 RepID=A0A9D3V5W3_9ROSI|nr:hypothetical protein J1N35_024843 [Gossypium stocksii]